MKISWKTLLGKITIWLLLEIALNVLGLDNLADYSEFVFNKHCVLLPIESISLRPLILD